MRREVLWSVIILLAATINSSALNIMDATYDQLANRLREQHLNNNELNNGQQHWISIAGGPGSGKTTTAEAIAEKLNAMQKDCCTVLPVDGFHYSQAKLKELDPPDGDKYLRRRGAPWTFDAESCVELLTKAKKNKCAILPTYDRSISDPVDGGVELLASTRIVLIEGLYLLLKDDERWAPLDSLWNERWFVKAPSLEIQRKRLIDRSVKTWSEAKAQMWGPGREGATARVDANDTLNMKTVAHCEAYADTIVVTV